MALATYPHPFPRVQFFPNKGLTLFRSFVILAYFLQSNLQSAEFILDVGENVSIVLDQNVLYFSLRLLEDVLYLGSQITVRNPRT